MALAFATQSLAAAPTYSDIMAYLRANGFVVYSLKSCGDGKWIADTQYSYDTLVLTSSSGITGTQSTATPVSSGSSAPRIVVVEDGI